MTQERNEPALESWKEIAAYLKRDVTTVRRWEKTERLPVHRHLHESRASVFAYASELEAWLATRTPAQRAQEAAPARPGVARFAVLAAGLLMAVTAAGDGAARSLAATMPAQGLTARQLWAGRAVDTTGEVTPDGRTLSFVDWETGDLAMRDLTSGAVRPLTQKGTWADSFEFALNSTFAPAARQIAYAWFTKDMGWEVRTVSTDGGAHRVIYSPEGVNYVQPSAWSPDGAHILTLVTRSDNTNQLVLVPAAGGPARTLKTLDWRYPLRPVFSPDGRFILFDFAPSSGAPQRDIFVMAAEGTGELPIAPHAANDFLPVWTPDGQSIVFLSDRGGSVGLWSIAAPGGTPQGSPRMLKADMGRVSMMMFDAAGALHYALETGMTDIFVSAVDFASGLVLDPPASISETVVGANRGADWSPDGTQIAYLSQRLTGPAAVRNPSIVIRSLADGSEVTLRPALTRPSRPRWSRDGRSLLVFAHDTNGRQGMYVIDARTQATSLLFALPGQAYAPLPVWSADGSAVFYTYPKDGTFVVHKRSVADGREETVLRAANAHNLAPSPDGRFLAFTYPSNEKDGTESTLAVLPLGGGEPRRVVTMREPDAFALDSVEWTPDARYLTYVTRHLKGGPHSAWRVPAEGGDPQKLNLQMQGTNVGLRIHPDGRRIAFTSGERASEVWVLEGLLSGRR